MQPEAYVLPSPIGCLLLRARGECLTGLTIFTASDVAISQSAPSATVPPVIVQARRELKEYFSGNRTRFEVPCDLDGLPSFTRNVLETLRHVPFGHTLTYGELAVRVGSPRAVRAVGRAMAINPLPIIIPCHRVVASRGKIGGYSGGGGVGTKSWLLGHEGNLPAEESPEFSRKTA